ncbi:MAG: glutamate formimidoyltransferase [Bacteroidetes bacterium]|nr:glutamate formimidoyltransferase [Bacteroidota bacterium]
MSKAIIECVPNFSEGRDMHIIKQITDEIERIDRVRLLDVDPGKATNRTVVTFVGTPEQVIEAAFQAIKKAAELIDMSKHQGEHPRMGATDVCPLIPISGISMEETVEYAKQLGARVGLELGIPVYLYESAATKPERKNLATIRAGEYEGLSNKMTLPDWRPDYGPNVFNSRSGASVIGARDFLVAYNVNLNTTSTRRANSVAFDVREAGRVKRTGDPILGAIERDEHGNPLHIPGSLKSVKAIGWFIEEYGIAQISMNLTNINITPLHIAFDEVCKKAEERGLRVTGSELVGLVPLKCLTDAGKYFLEKQKRSAGVSEEELIRIAVKSLGLDELSPFDPNKKIIEYILRDLKDTKLIQMSLRAFANETASESPAPGGGSISAYLGSLGASLATMVANLSSHKKGWDARWQYFSSIAEKGQQLKDELLKLVDEDTRAFSQIMQAYALPKSNDEEKLIRTEAIQQATIYATEVPIRTMRTAYLCFEVVEAMAQQGNPNSISDAGVGALCIRSAILGAYLNVCINASGIKEERIKGRYLSEAVAIRAEAVRLESQIIQFVEKQIAGNNA